MTALPIWAVPGRRCLYVGSSLLSHLLYHHLCMYLLLWGTLQCCFPVCAVWHGLTHETSEHTGSMVGCWHVLIGISSL